MEGSCVSVPQASAGVTATCRAPADTSPRLSLTALVATGGPPFILVVCALLLHQHHRRAALRRSESARVNGGERTASPSIARPKPHGANGQPVWTTAAVREPGEWDERECLALGELDVLGLKVNHKHPGGCPITLEETGLYVGKVTVKRKGGENGVNSAGDKRKRGGSNVAAGDDLRNYSYEGEGSSPGSLSSCLESCGGSAKFLGGFREVARALESWEPPSVRSTHSTPTKMESSPPPTATLCSTHHSSPISGHHTPCPPAVPAHTMPLDLLTLPMLSEGVSQGFPTPES
ncbi:hypothetical protein GWK47_034273 [Chionoecetes opilio]|uniref:Uncharacterized protein n=1 Tax=Chionoecetes opilio TaxID=41210 RepID=A0A8J4YGA2_CHIOP|nr:hypothetical protein GWK47_034273 [Chionoecetes opilio]